jgi:integrase
MSTRGNRTSKRYNIHVYDVKGTIGKGRDKQEIEYYEAAWVVPAEYTEGKRRQIKATSRRTAMEALMRCEEKVDAFLAEKTGTAPVMEKARTRKSAAPVNSLRTDHTVQEFLQEWFDAQVDSDRWAENSKLRIEQGFRDHIFPYLGSIPLTELTKRDVRLHFTKTLPGIMAKDKEGKPTKKRLLGDSRIQYIFVNFRAAIRAADAKNFTDGDPTFQIHRPKRPDAAGSDQMVVDLMKALLVAFADPKNDDVDTLRFALSFFMGMRRGERCGLFWSDIDDLDDDQPTITIQRQLSYVSQAQGGAGHLFTESTKTGRDRIVPIHSHVVDLLRIHRDRVDKWKKNTEKWEPREGFGDLILIKESGKFEPLNDDYLIFRKWLTKVGIDIPGVKPGSLRHASATWWATENNQDEDFLRAVLGWSKKSDLTGYYTRKNQDQLKNKMKAGDDWKTKAKPKSK